MSSVADLASFRLIEPLGAGGMGTVWRAIHLPDAGQVAVKLVGSLDERARARFTDEVRATAGLAHPHVVRVLDAGCATRSTGQVAAGTSWLAMELAEGTLADPGAVGDWPRLVHVLDQILRGLAHAHARGVIHRDLKPANVLRFPLGVCKLGDFGLARIAGGSESRGGTPAYMAPEQIRGDPALVGPATDLYGVGCVAWELWTGSPPFASEASTRELFNAHLFADPHLPALRGVPEDFGTWLLSLLAKEPAERPASAAHAREALRRLPPAPASVRLPAAGEPTDRRTSAWAAGLSSGATGMTTDDLAHLPIDDAPPEARPTERHDLRLEVPSEAPEAVVQAPVGVGLLTWREPPFVGRREEVGAVWAVLRRVMADSKPRLVVLEGERGVGKSALAEWVAASAHEEVGCAVLRSGTGGLAAALAAALGVVVGSADQAVARVEARLSLQIPELRRSLGLALGHPDRLLPADRAAAVGWGIAALAPVVVVVDDLDEAPDERAVVASVLSRAAPVLVIATATALLATQTGTHVVLGPLAALHLGLALRKLAPLAPIAIDRISQASDGVPARAVALARRLATHPGTTWRRGELVPPDDALPTAESPADADEAHAVARALAGVAPDARAALVLAALLGPRSSPGDWAACCAAAGLAPPWGVVDALEELRLVRSTWDPARSRSWWFRSLSIARAVSDGVNPASVAGPALEALARRAPRDWPRLVALAAATGDRAVEVEVRLAELRFRRARNDRARVAEERLAPLVAALPDDHPAALEFAVLAAVGLGMWRPELRPTTVAELEALAARAEAAGHLRVACAAQRWAGRTWYILGSLDEALRLHDLAVGHDTAAVGADEAANARWERATTLTELGRLEAAEADLGRADAEWRALPDTDLELAWCAVAWSNLRRRQDRLEEALQWLDGAEELYTRGGSLAGAAVCAANRGLTHQAMGDLDRATEALDQAVRLAEGRVLPGSVWLFRALRLPIAWQTGSPGLSDEVEALLLHPAIPQRRRRELLAWRVAWRARAGRLDGLEAALAEISALPFSPEADVPLSAAAELLPPHLGAQLRALRSAG